MVKIKTMTEWKKLQIGKIYNDFDQDLFNRRVEAKKLFRAYNHTEDNEMEKRNRIMKVCLNPITHLRHTI